jgi:tetratricopeptide (TPR) repeat protein
LNSALYEQAKLDYNGGDFAAALKGFYSCLKDEQQPLQSGELGLIYVRLGNCLLKLRNFKEAAVTYQKALEDEAYQDKSSIFINLGKALVGSNEPERAVEAFNKVLEDRGYKKQYQAYLGLGNAYARLDRMLEAGSAYRSAALDEANPNPIKSLVNLGACFIALNRPADALEVYKTVFDFNPTKDVINKVHESMGRAYVLADNYQSAVDSFQDALRDGSYQLSAPAESDYILAANKLKEPKDSLFALPLETGGQDDSGLDLISVPYNEVDVKSAAADSDYVPSPNDTGFFTATDAQIEQLSKKQLKKERKVRHLGLKIFLVVVILIVLVLGAGVFAYSQGIGYPSAETVITDFFVDNAEGKSTTQYWAATDADDLAAINRNMEMVAPTNNVSIDYVERSMLETKMRVAAILPEGGTIHYNLTLTRDLLTWKIVSIETAFGSQQ